MASVIVGPSVENRSLPHVAVIGCGYWGKNLVRVFAELGALAAVCDADAAIRDGFATRYRVAGLSFDEVLANPAIDAVAIATPAATHADLALAALDAGKHVFVEKPLALDLESARKVRDRAQALGLTLMVGHLLRYHPAFIRLEELVAEGALGRLQYIYSNRLNLGKFRREENVFWSFAPHDISMILALVGEDPERIEAVGHCYLHKNIADVTTTHLWFPSGVNAHIFVSWLHPFKEQKLVVVGSEAMAVFDDGEPWESKLCIYRHRVAWRNGMPEPVKADSEAVELVRREPLTEECRHFLECVQGSRRPRSDADEAIRVLSVLAQAERSLTGSVSTGGRQAPDAESVFVHPTAIVDRGAEIGAGSRIWHFSHIFGRARIGRNVTVGQNVMIGPGVKIGDRCKIQNNVSIYEGVVLEDEVFCGPSCVFTNVLNPRAGVERKSEFRPTIVRKGATIGANATIVCGIELGEYCFVGAGAVVTRSVPAHALVVGNPARQIGWVSRSGERLGDDLVCPRTGECYVLREGKLALQDEMAEGALQ
ncbi:MAG: oxidoreductase [Nitrospiraceae bacterium]|nr:MAG: oxidoreductase [Nitrospiraceae bacterium]